jgi:hypothetical protein
MRRLLYVLALVLGFGLPLIALSPVQAQDLANGPVAFTIHKASCPIDYTGGIYEACHENPVEGVGFTIAGTGEDPVAFASDADGVATAMILDGITEITDVTLTEDAAFLPLTGAYAYCKDQVGGLVLFDGTVPESGTIELGTVNSSQVIICDWYNYAPAEGVTVTDANG